jgi:hypothetical protein
MILGVDDRPARRLRCRIAVTAVIKDLITGDPRGIEWMIPAGFIAQGAKV